MTDKQIDQIIIECAEAINAHFEILSAPLV